MKIIPKIHVLSFSITPEGPRKSICIKDLIFVFFLLCIGPQGVWAQGVVKFENHPLEVNGIQLFASAKQENAFYYLPKEASLARNQDSLYECLLIKYKGTEKTSQGGLFHALFQFNISQKEEKQLAAALRKKHPGAKLLGQLPLADKNDQAFAKFQIVSSILNSEADWTAQIISSGKAPITPDDKVAIAAQLSRQGATLLWNSLQLPTSDLSVTVSAYYKALGPSFTAQIQAQKAILHQALSKAQAERKYGLWKEEVFELVDSLQQQGVFSIQINDHQPETKNSQELEELLAWIGRKLLADWFIPSPTQHEGNNEIPRQGYLLKALQKIQEKQFLLTLKARHIQYIPIIRSGNLQLATQAQQMQNPYLSLVDFQRDELFESATVSFQVDAPYLAAFQQLINTATVHIRAKEPNASFWKHQIHFDAQKIQAQGPIQSVQLPSGGVKHYPNGFEYKIVWNLQGMDSLISPHQWLPLQERFILLKPPFDQTLITLDIDRHAFGQDNFKSFQIRFATVLHGQPQIVKKLIIRRNEGEGQKEIILYHDPKQPIYYQLNWYGTDGQLMEEMQPVTEAYLLVHPPTQAQ
ncbi:MAG: hypothetical protein KTR30_29875 [Saprospiraceae bacterium]|nr:hypothetical protein [Saprospiraceae bacterium]